MKYCCEIYLLLTIARAECSKRKVRSVSFAVLSASFLCNHTFEAPDSIPLLVIVWTYLESINCRFYSGLMLLVKAFVALVIMCDPAHDMLENRLVLQAHLGRLLLVGLLVWLLSSSEQI